MLTGSQSRSLLFCNDTNLIIDNPESDYIQNSINVC
jgi:hypothetical protein